AALGAAVGADIQNELRNVESLDDRIAELGMRAPVSEEAAESGEAARSSERITRAVPRVMQEPGETSTLSDLAERRLRVSFGEVDERRSQRRHCLDEARGEPGDDSGLDVPS